MIIYVKNENKTIRVLSASELHDQLTATPHTIELDSVPSKLSHFKKTLSVAV